MIENTKHSSGREKDIYDLILFDMFECLQYVNASETDYQYHHFEMFYFLFQSSYCVECPKEQFSTASPHPNLFAVERFNHAVLEISSL